MELTRATHTAPPPLKLPQNIKEDLPKHPPRAVVLAEAAKMGQLNMETTTPPARPVPGSYADYAQARSAYNQQVCVLPIELGAR